MIKLYKSSVEKIQDLLYNSKLDQHIFSRIDDIECEIFIINRDLFDKELLNQIKKYQNSVSFFDSGVICKNSNQLLLITYDDYKIENLCTILVEHNIISRAKYNKLIYDVYKYLSTSYNDINDIKNKYKSAIITKSGIIIASDIVPNRFIYNGKIHTLPEKCRTKIKSVEFIVNSENKIVSVKIDGKHPNSDKSNEFCLGNLKFLELNLKSVNDIINSITIYNIDNSYYIPDNIKQILNTLTK